MVKRRELLKEVKLYAKETGESWSVTEGGSHSKVTVGTRTTFVPRHTEIKESLAKIIRKQVGKNK